MSAIIKRRLRRLEDTSKALHSLPAWLITSGPVCVIDQTVKVLVPEKRYQA